MKESKDEAILPCYRDGYCVWHYSDYTRDKVYELNKQMCDVEIVREKWDKIGKEWDSKKEEIVKSLFGSIENQIKEDIMEEKKTRKMTKAEAFEWLKCKKIDASGYADTIQKKLFSFGFVWSTGDTNVLFTSYLLIDNLGELSHCGLDDIYFKRHCYEEIKVEDILSLEIVDECAKDGDGDYAANKISLLGSQICEILRQMNGHYHVEITEDDVHLYPEGTNLYHSDPF